MSLRYFMPHLPLQSFIRSFSILEEPQTVFNKRLIVPDSFPALLVNLGAPFIWEMDNGMGVELPNAFFVRAQTHPLKIRATGACLAFGLNLMAWGSRFFVGEQVDLSSAPIVPLDGRWRELAPLLASTFATHGDHEALATFVQFVSDLTCRTQLDIAPVRSALEMLYSSNGRYNMNSIAAHCYLSPSQLERRSNYLTGLSPKTLARLIRFDAACAGLLHDSGARLTDLAYELGYVDQAHFIHEFRTFADFTPREARAYVHALAADAEFLQFS
jgi:AraC-like DNA-binding protein